MRLIDADEVSRLWCKGCDACKKNMDKIPTIEPKRAEWIKREVSYFVSPYEYECGGCGFQITQNERTAFNFCPSCGADMKGEL